MGLIDSGDRPADGNKIPKIDSSHPALRGFEMQYRWESVQGPPLLSSTAYYFLRPTYSYPGEPERVPREAAGSLLLLYRCWFPAGFLPCFFLLSCCFLS